MPRKKTEDNQPTIIATAMVVNAPAPVTVSAPDTAELVQVYTDTILPLDQYTIETPQQYVDASRDWQMAKDFVARIDKLFEDACDNAYKAHRALTSLRENIKAPAAGIARKIGDEMLRFKAEEDRKRRVEEARLEAAETARRAAELAEAEAAERERQARLAEKEPWELEDADLTPVAPPPAVLMVPVRLPSTVPVIAGGPRIADKPWTAVVTDPVAFLKWVIEDHANRLQYVSFNAPLLNAKARELGADLGSVIAGVEGRREQTVRRA